jgi:tetratricopeptide (TPR) repeat protein
LGSIYLYSEKNHKCVELQASQIQTSDLVGLQGLLPRNLQGIQFTKPSPGESEIILFHSESRQPYVSKYLMDVGQKLMGLGQPLGALRLFDLALRVRQDPKISLLRAESLVGLGRMEEAKKEIDRFLRWQPNNGTAHYLLGRIYLNRDDYRVAEGYFRVSLSEMGPMDGRRDTIKAYLEFNQIYLDRDGLYSRNLSAQEYVTEIQTLRNRVRVQKAKVLEHPDREVRGMEPHLDHLDKTFERWMVEIAARNPETLPLPLRSQA